MTRQYEVTIHSVGPMATDYFVTTEEPPYWEVDDKGVTIFIGDMQTVAFVKRDYFSAVTVEVLETDQPSSFSDPDTLLGVAPGS